MASRVRRPARGGFLFEFVLGLCGGIVASVVIAALLKGDSQPDAETITSILDQQKTLVSEQERGNVWRPKERFPGYKDPKILCVVTQTLPQSIVPAQINATWGQRCDRLVFSTRNEEGHPFETVKVEKMGKIDSKWATYRSLFVNLDIQDADYVFVVEDQTYAIPDNVRYEFRGPNPGSHPLFWGRKSNPSSTECAREAFVLSRETAQALKVALAASKSDEPCGTAMGSSEASTGLSECLKTVRVLCQEALDFQGKKQFMNDPVQLLGKGDEPAHLRTGPECCSVLPVAFIGVSKTQPIRTGLFSYNYYYDYFIRDTAVYGREYMRPLNGMDAGANKMQIGF